MQIVERHAVPITSKNDETSVVDHASVAVTSRWSAIPRFSIEHLLFASATHAGLACGETIRCRSSHAKHSTVVSGAQVWSWLVRVDLLTSDDSFFLQRDSLSVVIKARSTVFDEERFHHRYRGWILQDGGMARWVRLLALRRTAIN